MQHICHGILDLTIVALERDDDKFTHVTQLEFITHEKQTVLHTLLV